MALVASIHKSPNPRAQLHGPVDCGYAIFTDEGRIILQLDTYGSSSRQIPGKISQSLQFDADAAAQLVPLLRKAFPELF